MLPAAKEHNAANQATIILSLILFCKVIFSNLKLGLAKKNAGARAPEDRQADESDVSEDAVKTLDRARRITSNDQENIPYVMVLAWGAIIIQVDNPSYFRWHIALYTAFVAARILHTIAYSFGLSLFRSTVFFGGINFFSWDRDQFNYSNYETRQESLAGNDDPVSNPLGEGIFF